MGYVSDKKITAFTLIELLLVIAVASILTAIGIMSYRRYFQVNRIDKVAISMQHVLEAAMAYYVDNSKWPATVAGSERENFIDNYLPNRSDKSYYGSDFQWGVSGIGQHLFWVAVQIPVQGDETITTAKRLAARLPNAITTSDPETDDPAQTPCTNQQCYVRAEITVPGLQSQQQSQVTLAAIGDCKTGQTVQSGTATCFDQSDAGNQKYRIEFKSCPEGMQPNLRINPNFISFPSSNVGWAISQIKAVSLDDCSQFADTKGNEACDAVVNVDVCTDILKCRPKDVKNFAGATVGASYVISCNQKQGGGNEKF